MPTLYIVRDIATQGADFLLWGEDMPGHAALSFIDAIADGLDVELITIPSNTVTYLEELAAVARIGTNEAYYGTQ